MSNVTTYPASAGAVSRALGAARIRKAVKITGRVRGYHNWQEGVRVTGQPNGSVLVEYRFDHFDRREHAEKAAATERTMTRAAEALTAKGYVVETRVERASTFHYLLVRKATL